MSTHERGCLDPPALARVVGFLDRVNSKLGVIVVVPRVARIVRTDWPAFICVFLVPWVLPWMAGVSLFRGFWDLGNFTILAVSLILLDLSVVIIRVRRIRRFFTRGQRVTGRVDSVVKWADRVQIDFSFECDRVRYSSWAWLANRKQASCYKADQEIDVLVLPSGSLMRAIIRSLYV